LNDKPINRLYISQPEMKTNPIQPSQTRFLKNMTPKRNPDLRLGSVEI